MDNDAELGAMRTALGALNGLDAEAQARVWTYVKQRLGIDALPDLPPTREEASKPNGEPRPATNMSDRFGSFAELYERTQPSTHSLRALVGGYWLQVCGGQGDFEAFPVNKELQNLGHKLPNVTDALTQLKKRSPALAMQVKKSGKSAQARKRYRLTDAGIKVVEEMLKSSGV